MRNLAIWLVLSLAALPVSANEFEPQIRSYLENEILAWANNSVLTDAIIAQNQTSARLSDADILDLDTQWRAEVGKADAPTITPVISNPAAQFLKDKIAASGGAIMEIFIMDMRGLNVAASGVTSDYWQGDESKFEKTFMAGAGAVFIDEVEFDESTQSYLAQVSITLVDPESGEPVGAMTVGLNAAAL